MPSRNENMQHHAALCEGMQHHEGKARSSALAAADAEPAPAAPLEAHLDARSSVAAVLEAAAAAAGSPLLPRQRLAFLSIQEWGQPGALPSLLQLRVDSNRL